jgi:hypothetical protein
MDHSKLFSWLTINRNYQWRYFPYRIEKRSEKLWLKTVNWTQIITSMITSLCFAQLLYPFLQLVSTKMPFREVSNKITTSKCPKCLFHYSHFCLHIIVIFLSKYNNVLDSKSLYVSSVTLSITRTIENTCTNNWNLFPLFNCLSNEYRRLLFINQYAFHYGFSN